MILPGILLEITTDGGCGEQADGHPAKCVFCVAIRGEKFFFGCILLGRAC